MNQTVTAKSRRGQPGDLERLRRSIMFVFEAVAAIAVIALMGQVLWNVFMRLVFSQPIAGTNEIVGNWLLPLVAFLGFVVAKSRGEHIEATLVYDRLSAKNKFAFSLTANIVSAIAMAVFTYYSFLEALHAFEVKLEQGVTGVPIWPVKWVVPLAFGLLAIMFAIDAVREIKTRRPIKGEAEFAEGVEADSTVLQEA